jgi:hypothetical protein
MKLNIRDFSLGHLLNMRHVIRDKGLKMRFTVKEINDECDRRARMTIPISVGKDPSIYKP